MSRVVGFEDRWVTLGPGAIPIPERLLLSHARGEVLFITGAGTSRLSGLPDFRNLVIQVYERLDSASHAVISSVPAGASADWLPSGSSLTSEQLAEVGRFVRGDYDVVLGMLERRLDGTTMPTSRVRKTVVDVLGQKHIKPADIHKALIRLADRGPTTTIATTNFDRLLEIAAAYQKKRIPSYSLGAIPRPGRAPEFSGILHIHGVLSRHTHEFSDFVVSDQDFGEFYLRRRIVPDFIYDAARLFNVVLVGYSANDAPMRYLLNAVAADGSRFSDLRERFAFISKAGKEDPILIEDWKGRGITPIPYDSSSGHAALGDTLGRWAELSSLNGKQAKIDSAITDIVRTPRINATDANKDLFDHLVRRSSRDERRRISKVISRAKAEISWLDAILHVNRERRARPAE